MNEFLLLAVVVIYLAINPLYSKPTKNYFIANYRLLRTKENSLWKDT